MRKIVLALSAALLAASCSKHEEVPPPAAAPEAKSEPSEGAPRIAITPDGVHVQYRASLEQDLAAMREWQPDLAIGTTPIVQAAKQASIPSLYFTNLISARPLMGPMGAGSLAQVINSAVANKGRFATMSEFFGGAGKGHAAGVWETTPQDRPEFKADTRRQMEKLAKKRKAEQMF